MDFYDPVLYVFFLSGQGYYEYNLEPHHPKEHLIAQSWQAENSNQDLNILEVKLDDVSSSKLKRTLMNNSNMSNIVT